MKTRRLLVLLPLACLLALCGCIEFEKQTLTYRYDTATDTLKIYQCYQGIFGGTKGDALSDEEEDQLKSVLERERTFAFNNWIFEYHRNQLQETLEGLRKPQEGDGPRMDDAMIARAETFFKLALANVKVVNGPMYYGEGGKLCGVQEVTVTQFSKIITAANLSIRDLYKLESERDSNSTEERDIYRKSVGRAPDYLKMDGNKLTVHLPMTRADFDKSFGAESENIAQTKAFQRLGGTIRFATNEFTLMVGDPKAKTTALTLPVSREKYSPNAVELAKKRTKVLDKFDADAAAAKFLGQ